MVASAENTLHMIWVLISPLGSPKRSLIPRVCEIDFIGFGMTSFQSYYSQSFKFICHGAKSQLNANPVKGK